MSLKSMNLPWKQKAQCWGKTTSPSTDYWYPDDDDPNRIHNIKIAKSYCKLCPVMSECLDYALSNDEEYGIWGGMTPRERRKHKRKKDHDDKGQIS